ncbi:MAG: type VI secretion system contractile sheath large subunit [Alphaproteobacteria bacterium]|nr:type VI secretion system contractile sheath large subunit [Alphaproteobacteria bacterium]
MTDQPEPPPPPDGDPFGTGLLEAALANTAAATTDPSPPDPSTPDPSTPDPLAPAPAGTGPALPAAALPAASLAGPAALPQRRADDEEAAIRRRRFAIAATRADRVIAMIDRILARQVNEIIHHPRFQKLEASWRGLQWLVAQSDGARDVVVRVMNMSWAEVARDFDRALEFDQSQLFQKIYTEEFDTPGGTPYGLLICDYEVSQHPRDVAALRSLAGVAAASFAPAILSASPRLFQIEHFRALLPHLDLAGLFRRPDYTAWNSLRKMDDSRFLGITLPRVVMRLPYKADGTRRDGFVFDEHHWQDEGAGWLWGSAAWAFGAIVIRSFSTYGWFGDLRGTQRDRAASGLVNALPTPYFETDRPGVAIRHPVEMQITERQERELSELGFIPLQAARMTPYLVFHSNQSVQMPQRYDRPAARANAKLSSMLQQIFCAARFAHFLKVIVRDKVGSFLTAREIEMQLQNWLTSYCMANDSASLETKALYPLRDGRVEVRELPGKPGHYACVAHLQPQFQLDEVSTVFRLVTQLAPRAAA